MNSVLDVRGLRARYTPALEILKGVDLSVRRGDFLAIIGPSGSGKSTLIRCINRLVEPEAGRIQFHGIDLLALDAEGIRHARRQIGMIFQEFNLVERMSVIDNVLMGRLGYTGLWRSTLRAFPRDDVRQALALLDRVGLSDHVDKRVDKLSGGQRQRVGIARALIQNPQLLLVDEPTSSLDPRIAREVMGLIRDVAREREIPALCVIHDVNLALEFCTRVIGLQGGEKKFEGPAGEVDRGMLADLYAMEVL